MVTVRAGLGRFRFASGGPKRNSLSSDGPAVEADCSLEGSRLEGGTVGGSCSTTAGTRDWFSVGQSTPLPKFSEAESVVKSANYDNTNEESLL